MDVCLIRSKNFLIVDSLDPKVIGALASALQFETNKRHFDRRSIREGNVVEVERWNSYILDHKKRLVTSFGFYRRVAGVLLRLGRTPKLRTLNPPDPEIFRPRWERLIGPNAMVTLRPGQREFLETILKKPCGRFSCPPGFGKTFLIACLGLLLPKARIHVVTKRIPVLAERMYPELCEYLPDVGICCGSRRKVMGCRVQLFSADSLRHSKGDADILVGDEIHELVTENYAEKLAVYRTSRNYGLSATHDMRSDGADFRAEAIFGPIVYHMSYQEAVGHQLVVPIQVVWSDVIMDYNPVADIVSADTVERKRYGLWMNEHRNQVIAHDAKRYDDRTQVLITCETVEHALRLRRHLPDFEVVYAANGIKSEDKPWFLRHNLLRPGEQVMTEERKGQLTEAFTRGVLKKAIATTVWNVGVSFNSLPVLVRADGTTNPIADTQIGGRTSRRNEGKAQGRVHDYGDQFDDGFMRRAQRRAATYRMHGWEQVDVEDIFKAG